MSALPPKRTDTTFPAQAPLPKIHGVVRYTHIDTGNVTNLKATHFALATDSKVAIVYNDFLVVLFYVENQESMDMIEIFLLVAQQVAGVKFGACNLVAEKEVAGAFMELGSKPGPLAQFSPKGYPFILAYQDGYPKAYCNGVRSVEDITSWILTRARDPGYYEPKMLAGSMQVEAPYVMPPYDPYGVDKTGKFNPKRLTSLDYSGGKPVRGYNPNLGGPVYEGSPEAIKAAETLRQAETKRASQGGVLYPFSDTLAPKVAQPAGPASPARPSKVEAEL